MAAPFNPNNITDADVAAFDQRMDRAAFELCLAHRRPVSRRRQDVELGIIDAVRQRYGTLALVGISSALGRLICAMAPVKYRNELGVPQVRECSPPLTGAQARRLLQDHVRVTGGKVTTADVESYVEKNTATAGYAQQLLDEVAMLEDRSLPTVWATAIGADLLAHGDICSYLLGIAAHLPWPEEPPQV